jgi:LAO/AO transport system kinase
LLFNEENIKKLQQGHHLTLAKCISLVENNDSNSAPLLESLVHHSATKCIGITGAPGAGKSTLINALIKEIVSQNKKVAILSVDPSSPFNYGALLGDRIRMAQFYTHPNVYIRSLASRGALGGLHPRIIEVVEVLKSCNFDYIIIETVGVGQSEVDIAGIADTTIVVVVPEGGDEVQTLKAGVMEIADIFVVNKADRPLAATFEKNLKLLSHTKATQHWEVPVLKTVATTYQGIPAVLHSIEEHHIKLSLLTNYRKQVLTAQKVYQVISKRRMLDVSMPHLIETINKLQANTPNLYTLINKVQASL